MQAVEDSNIYQYICMFVPPPLILPRVDRKTIRTWNLVRTLSVSISNNFSQFLRKSDRECLINRSRHVDFRISPRLPYRNPREASSRPRIFLISLEYLCFFVYVVFVYVFICLTSPGPTKNDTDLIFGTHTRIDLILKRVFCFAEKILVTAASLKKLPCHVDFSHISLIALFNSKSTNAGDIFIY